MYILIRVYVRVCVYRGIHIYVYIYHHLTMREFKYPMMREFLKHGERLKFY